MVPCSRTIAIPHRLSGRIVPPAQLLMGLQLSVVRLLKPTLHGVKYQRGVRKTIAYQMGCA